MAEIFGTGLAAGGGSTLSTIIVDAPDGSTVTCTDGSSIKTGIGIPSKNLFPYTKISSTEKDGVTFSPGADGMVIAGTPISQWVSNRIVVSLAPGQYVLGGKIFPTNGKVHVEIVRVFSDGKWETTVFNGTQPKTLTIDGSESYIEAYITTTGFDSQQISVFAQPMLVAGSQAAEFEPYYENERFTFKNITFGAWGVVQEKSGQQKYSVVYVNQAGVYRMSL